MCQVYYYQYVPPLGAQDASIGIEYWVVLNQRKRKGEEYTLRSQSNELFVESGYPIVGTLNGQNQGQLNARLLRDAGLGMVARHIVIHLDATNASSKIRRELFSTSREGFKEGPVLEDLIRILRKMLEEDENLFAISGPTFRPGGTEKQIVPRPRPHPIIPSAPLPTLPFPQVTRFEIVFPIENLRCHISDNESVLVETDADPEFDRQGRIAIRCERPALDEVAKTPLRGGRLRWRFRPKPEARVGDTGTIVATITRPDGSQITDQVLFEVLPPIEERAKKEKGFVPPFDIVPINPYDKIEEWTFVWPGLDDSSPLDKLEGVAYKPMKVGPMIKVYYSTIFTPFKAQVDKLKADSAALLDLFRTNYEVWIGYHAILQINRTNAEPEDAEPEALDKLYEMDRVRVAQMQVKQAARTAELQQKIMRASMASES